VALTPEPPVPADTPGRNPSRAELLAAAAAAAAELAPPPDWPAAGRAMPAARWVPALRAAGWPVATVEVDLPQREHRGPRAGQRTADAPQPVTVVPAAWLRAMARALGVRWADACRGVVADVG
jgi:hypothetical protein